jgi:hypothetical protein
MGEDYTTENPASVFESKKDRTQFDIMGQATKTRWQTPTSSALKAPATKPLRPWCVPEKN